MHGQLRSRARSSTSEEITVRNGFVKFDNHLTSQHGGHIRNRRFSYPVRRFRCLFVIARPYVPITPLETGEKTLLDRHLGQTWRTTSHDGSKSWSENRVVLVECWSTTRKFECLFIYFWASVERWLRSQKRWVIPFRSASLKTYFGGKFVQTNLLFLALHRSFSR